VVRGGVLAVKPVNDTILLTISLTLPSGFAYVLNEFHVNIQVDTASDWHGEGQWRLSQTSPANLGFDYRFPIPFILTSQNGVDLAGRGTRVDPATVTRTPIIPLQGGATQSVHFVNLAAAVQAAGTVDSVISFWEYDLNQAVYFPIHAPVGVYSR